MSLTSDQIEGQLKFLIANAVNNSLTMGVSDDLGAEVIHIGSSIPRLLRLSITNTLTEEIKIEAVSGKPSESQHHFHIRFTDNRCFVAPPTVVHSAWRVAIAPPNDYVQDIYLLSPKPIKLGPASSKDKTIVIDLLYTDAQLLSAEVEVLTLSVTVGQDIVTADSQAVTGTATIHLSTFTDAGAPIPLIAQLVQPRTILNDATDQKNASGQKLLLRLVNTSPEPIAFAPPPGGSITPTTIEFAIDIDATAAFALCKPDEANAIVVTPSAPAWKNEPKPIGTKQKTWVFRPDYSQLTKIDPNSSVDFVLNGVRTSLPPGFTNLYVTFREFPIYGTQTAVTQIEKSPLVYNTELGSGLMSKGTTGTAQALALNGTTTSELLLVEQIGAGNSAHFKGGQGVKIENNLDLLCDLHLNDHTMWLRPDANHGIGWYGTNKLFANTNVDGPVAFGNLGGALGSTNGGQKLVLRWNNEGKVGIGTANPLGPLSIGDASVPDSDGYIVIGKNIKGGGSQQYRLGFDNNFNFSIGDYGAQNIAKPWTTPFAIAYDAPNYSFYVDGHGHVGVGTDKPLGPLSVGNASVVDSDGYIVVGKRTKDGSRQYRLGFDSKYNFIIGDYGADNVAATWTSPFALAYNAPDNSLRVDGSGRVGIGTNNPLGPLSIGDSSVAGSDGYIVIGKKGPGNATRQYRLGFDKDYNFVIGDYGHDNVAEPWTSPFAVQWAAPSNSLYIDGNGRVGLGTNQPTKAGLDVRSNVLAHPTIACGLVANDGCYTYQHTLDGDRNFSIYADDVIWCNAWVIASSDARIKRIAGRSNGVEDLNTLLGIEITDYSYIDSAANDTRTHKKVIAQQVRQVFPQAVSQTTNVIPDIYQQAKVDDGWVQLATDLKIGERVRLIAEKHDAVHEVLEVGEEKFRTDFVDQIEDVFVYGREVDDFLNVDYDAISMLSVSATQQLKCEKDAEVQALREENAALRSRLDKLEKLVNRLASAHNFNESNVTPEDAVRNRKLDHVNV